MAAVGLFIAPVDHLERFDSWADLDAEVARQLGPTQAAGFVQRYTHCFPKEFNQSIVPATFNTSGYLVTDGYGSCTLNLYHDENFAYIGKFCAFPQGQHHGTTFMNKLKEAFFFDSMDVYLFTDNGCDERLHTFYTKQCGFTVLDRDEANIPDTILDMWYQDTLYHFSKK